MARILLALVCVVLVATGCGVPDSSEPEVLGDAPGVGGQAVSADEVELPEPTRDLTPTDLVTRYLTAGAAADFVPDLGKEERITAAVTHARKYLSQIGKENWEPGTSIQVVEVGTMTPRIDDSVSVPLRRVGLLEGNGVLIPATPTPAWETEIFKIAPLAETGPRLLSSVPDNLLPLSLTGLQALFDVRPVYYWERTNRFLVPDRRYLSRGISADRKVKTSVARVLAGPSAFLDQAVLDPLAQAPIGNAVLSGNHVVVNLPASKETERDESLLQLADQLRWSLHPSRYSVELQVNSRRRVASSATSYEQYNPSQPRTNDGRNDRRLYAAVDGVVTPLEPGVPPPSILSRPENVNVVSAAVNVQQNSAALVRQIGAQKQLWVGRTPADGSAAQLRPVAFPAGTGTFSRPSYLATAGDRVLIVVDGTLYDVDLGSAVATPVLLQRLDGPPVAVSVAPDGTRVAIVTASRAYVATIDSSNTPAVVDSTAGAPIREVYLGGLANLRGVGWYSEHQIAVGGRAGLMISAIDGGALEPTGPTNLQGAQLTQLSAVPWDPAGGSGGNVVIEASGEQNALRAYRPYRQELAPIQAPPSAGSAPSASSSASPSGSSPPVLPRVTAPFYADEI